MNEEALDELLDERFEIIERELAQILNAHDLDAVIGCPDYIIARHMVLAAIGLGQSLSDIAEHRGERVTN